jgi:hypothetical protein
VPTPGDDISPSPCNVRRDANSDINQVLIYRQGFLDGCDGRGPFRDAWSYQRGWNSGDLFRKMISDKTEPFGQHFPGWPALSANNNCRRKGRADVAVEATA